MTIQPAPDSNNNQETSKQQNTSSFSSTNSPFADATFQLHSKPLKEISGYDDYKNYQALVYDRENQTIIDGLTDKSGDPYQAKALLCEQYERKHGDSYLIRFEILIPTEPVR